MSDGVTVAQFITKWERVDLPERAASHEHFLDLCRLLGQPTPAEHDATGAEYTFEKGVRVTGPASAGSLGKYGFADVWWRGKFAWEYKRKGKYKSLAEAYRQLCQYREPLENPPLLIVSDIARTEIHTNFTGTRKEIHTIDLQHVGHPDNLAKLRRVFTDPASFKPTLSTHRLTESTAAEFAKIADQLRQRGHDPHAAAHFLMKCIFCLFAEDVGLLPKDLFSKLLERGVKEPDQLAGRLDALFDTMRTGGDFGIDLIEHFNGGLFDDAPALPLTSADVVAMRNAGAYDWSAVEPSIFGTLFERSLDPSKRSQIGAHYTSREDIMLIVEPVVMAPLRREWDGVREEVDKQLARRRKGKTPATKKRADDAIRRAIDAFLDRLSEIRILDPACGSGNFLYVAIQELLALEKEVIIFASRPEIGLSAFPRVRPTQLHGLELNPYAAELAQVVIWIGYLQWMRDNGFIDGLETPILSPLTTIECRDAILKWEDADGHPLPSWQPGAKCAGPADWPAADFIIGNPPFLGVRLFRKWGLPDEYIDAMYKSYTLPNSVDLCCYWFEQARHAITQRKETRCGLLATQGIRGGDNRKVLARIKKAADIFMAWSDRSWILEGAAVRVSMVGFAKAPPDSSVLDGHHVPQISSALTGDTDTSRATRLGENLRIAFMGDTKGGAFDINWRTAADVLLDSNPTDCANQDVLRPWVNGLDITRRPRAMWIIDFGCDMPENAAARYHRPFELLRREVYPVRSKNRRASYAKRWWLHVEPRPAMRDNLPTSRFLATPNLTKHRLFVFMDGATLPDHQLIAYARSDDYFFGVLHSSIHELWARRMGTQLREAQSGFRYTPTSCFETFRLPWPPGKEPTDHPAHQRISAAAKELNDQRERWLNPPEWIEQLGHVVDSKDRFEDIPAEARPLIRHSAIMAAAAADPRFKKRTLTNLYNERPTWLRLAHEQLDRAVLAAYAAADPEGDWSEDWAAVWVETGAGQPLPDEHPLAAQRKATDQQVLTNLLRLNQARAAAQ